MERSKLCDRKVSQSEGIHVNHNSIAHRKQKPGTDSCMTPGKEKYAFPIHDHDHAC
jgi:hypothetical protein